MRRATEVHAAIVLVVVCGAGCTRTTGEGPAQPVPSEEERDAGAGDVSGAARGASPSEATEAAEWLFPIQGDGGCGYIDRTGRVVLPPTQLLPRCGGGFASNELYPFRDDHDRRARFGYFDARGEVVVEPRFSEAMRFYEGLATVREGDLAGYIDATGELVIPLAYAEADYFSEGLAAVQAEPGGSYGFIDQLGKMVIRPRFQRAFAFSEGLAIVETAEGVKAIDREGREVLAIAESNDARVSPIGFRDGLAVVTEGIGGCGYIDRTGRVVIPPRYSFFCSRFSEGLAAVPVPPAGVSPGLTSSMNSRWGFVDRAGRLAIPAQFEFAEPFSDGLAPVQRDGLWGYVDSSGAVAIDPAFTSAGPFEHGLAQVRVGLRWRYIDRAGRVVWAPTTEVVDGDELPLTELFESGSSRIEERSRDVIRDEPALRAAWRAAHGESLRPPPIPSVDLSTHDVIAVTMGWRSTCEAVISVTRVVETEEDVVVFVTEYEPSGMGGRAVATPIHWVSVPRRNKPYRFVNDTADCCPERPRPLRPGQT